MLLEKDSLRPIAEIQSFLARVATRFAAQPFKPHAAFRGGHAQTVAAYGWPRPYRFNPWPTDEERLFEIEPDVKVLGQCRWQRERQKHATLVMWHGIEGSTSSIYMIATADKAFRAGFNVIRVNFRNCGGSEHLTPTLYHGGMSGDLRAVVDELVENDGLQSLFLLGFSLGGNMVLKLAGEYAENPHSRIAGICALSPSVDLQASTDLILSRRNWIYHQRFVSSLKNRIQLKQKLFPELYDLDRLPEIRTIRDFDEEFTSLANGFANAADYYYRASSVRVAANIHIPTLIIHARDDPFIPFYSLQQKAFSENPYILLIAPKHGGHVGFISSKTVGEDRFWAENRVVEFFRMAEELL